MYEQFKFHPDLYINKEILSEDLMEFYDLILQIQKGDNIKLILLQNKLEQVLYSIKSIQNLGILDDNNAYDLGSYLWHLYDIELEKKGGRLD